MSTLREDYNNLDPELKHLFAAGDHEIAEMEDQLVVADFEFPRPTRELTAAESAALAEEISTNAMIEELFGIRPRSPFDVDCPPMGISINGKPLGKATDLSDQELVENISKIVKLRMEGNAEIEKFFR